MHHGEVMPMLVFVNDALMAVFFFVIGLEIKQEILIGELANSIARIIAMNNKILAFGFCIAKRRNGLRITLMVLSIWYLNIYGKRRANRFPLIFS